MTQKIFRKYLLIISGVLGILPLFAILYYSGFIYPQVTTPYLAIALVDMVILPIIPYMFLRLYLPSYKKDISILILPIIPLLITTALSISPLRSFFGVLGNLTSGYIEIAVVLISIAVYILIKDSNKFKDRLLRSISLVAFLLPLCTLIEFIGIPVPWAGAYSAFGQANGPLGNPSYTATIAILLLAVVPSARNPFKSNTSVTKNLRLGLLIILLLTPLITKNTTILLLLIPAVVIGYIYQSKLKAEVFLLSAAIVVLTLVTMLVSPEIFPSSQNTIKARLYITQESVNAIKQNPLLGFGGENFPYIQSRFWNADITNNDNASFAKPHNYPIEILLAQGIFGFLIYLFYLFLINKRLLDAETSKSKYFIEKIYQVLPVTAFTLYHLSLVTLFKIPQALILEAVVIPVLLVNTQVQNVTKEKPYAIKALWIYVTTGLAVAVSIALLVCHLIPSTRLFSLTDRIFTAPERLHTNDVGAIKKVSTSHDTTDLLDVIRSKVYESYESGTSEQQNTMRQDEGFKSLTGYIVNDLPASKFCDTLTCSKIGLETLSVLSTGSSSEYHSKLENLAVETESKYPKRFEAYQLMSKYYRKIGDYRAAVLDANRALEIWPDNPEMLYGLGEDFWKLGNTAESVRYARQSLEHNYNPTNIEYIAYLQEQMIKQQDMIGLELLINHLASLTEENRYNLYKNGINLSQENNKPELAKFFVARALESPDPEDKAALESLYQSLGKNK